MKKTQRGIATTEVLWILMFVVTLVGIGGWIANIVKFIGMDFGHTTGMLVVRGFGVFIPPLGAVLGFV